MHRGSWRGTVRGVAKRQTRLSHWPFRFLLALGNHWFVFYISVSCFAYTIVCVIFWIPHICDHTVFVFGFAEHILFSRSIHVAADGNIACFAWLSVCSVTFVFHVLFIRSSADRHSGCFPNVAIVNRVAVNAGVRVSL